MTVDDVPLNDVLLMLGELNARVGCNNKNRDMGMESLTAVKRISSSSAAHSSRTGTSTNSPEHHLTDEPRARLITSISNREALFKMSGQ